MTWFNNRRMAAKLAMAFGACVVLTALVGAQGLHAIATLHRSNDALAEQAHGWAAVKEADLGVQHVSRAIQAALLEENAAAIRKQADAVQRYRGEYEASLAGFEKTIVTPQARKALDELRRLDAEMRPIQDEVLVLALTGKADQGRARLEAAHALAEAIDEHIETIEKSKTEIVERTTTDSQATVSQATTVTLAIVVTAVLAAFAVAFVLTRLITRPLAESVRVLKAIADADFTQSLTASSADELGDMARAVNKASQQMLGAVSDVKGVASGMASGDMTVQVRSDLPGALGEMAASLAEAIVKMRTTLEEVQHATDTVASAAQQLASASEEISSGAQEQASSLEETAASLEEMTATIKQNADNAQQASQLTGGARGAAEQGGQVTADAVQAMDAINQSSKRIADIITTIDEIAFQTNLLALNAAVEAARAGEQGRGFAVVAAEVRNLAQRSASAAKEIKGLINDSVHKVDAGSSLVNASGRTLTEIVTSVKRVSDIVSEIAAAGREQAGGIEQVNKAVMQMEKVTQANASQTEEMSGTAESLAGEAEKLQTLIGQFKLGATRTPAARPAAPRAPIPMTPRSRGGAARVAAKAETGHTAGALALEAEFQEF